jgi:hypothetical protein
MSVKISFGQWMKEVDKIGIKERIFDKPGTVFLCSGSRVRRPYTGVDGVFYELWSSGCSPQQALGEALVEQDAE